MTLLQKGRLVIDGDETQAAGTRDPASYLGPTGELINIVKRQEKSKREGKICDGWWLILMSGILSLLTLP